MITGAARTPIGAFNGALSTILASELGAVVIAEAMKRSGGVKSKAATMLKIERRRLSRLLKKYQMG